MRISNQVALIESLSSLHSNLIFLLTFLVSREEDVEIFTRSDGIPVTITSEHSPKLTTMLKITENQSCIYYGNYGFSMNSLFHFNMCLLRDF
jgi:hypothetical protein